MRLRTSSSWRTSARHEFGLDAERAQLNDQCLPGIVASTGNHYARTFLGECERGCAPDAGQRAGDENGFPERSLMCVSLDC